MENIQINKNKNETKAKALQKSRGCEQKEVYITETNDGSLTEHQAERSVLCAFFKQWHSTDLGTESAKQNRSCAWDIITNQWSILFL